MTQKYDILVAGEVNPDLILSDSDLTVRFGQHEALVESATLTLGSSAVIFACGAVRLGLTVALIGVVGDDLFGHFVLEKLAELDVDVSNVIVDDRQTTGFSVILNRGTDRAILTHMGAMNALRAANISDDLLHQARHLHVTSYFLQTNLQPDLPDLFARARRQGLTTSLDTNWDPDERWTGVEVALAETTVFMPNAAEALAVTGLSDVKGAALRLAEMAEIVTVKQGGEGALCAIDTQLIEASAIPVPVVDTVGAGDTFDAGFIYGFLHGWDPAASLKLGIACGSLSTRGTGGITSQPTLEEARLALEAAQL